MKKLAIILGDYEPTPSPNTNCINEILKEFNDWEITIITNCYDKNICGTEKVDNRTIMRIYDKQKVFLTSKSTGIKKWFKHGIDYFINKVEFPDNRIVLRKKSKDIITFIGSKKFDAIISVCMPFSCHLVAMKYKDMNPNCIWFLYLLDPFSSNKYTKKHGIVYQKKAQKLEKVVYEKCDYIISMPEINISSQFRTKVLKAGIPLLKDNIVPLSKVGECYGVFAGSLIKGVREPEPVLDIFSQLFSKYKCDYVLKLYTTKDGYYQNTLKKYELETNNRIICEGIVQRKELISIYHNAQFLVNIGNMVFEQTPSKIFEYMSYGKPIIHFYADKRDTSIPYLQYYPNVLMINLNDYFEINVKKINKFLQSNIKVISFNELVLNGELRRCTPEYTAKLIKERVE